MRLRVFAFSLLVFTSAKVAIKNDTAMKINKKADIRRVTENISYFCRMKEVRTAVYRHSKDLPDMEYRNFFHGKALFMIYEQSRRQTPYMVVATAADGTVLAHLLAVVRYRTTLFPPFIYRHCRVFGEGEYSGICGDAAGDYPVSDVFEAMMRRLTAETQGKVLYTEVSHISSKMFGYRQFRSMDFFPVHWMSIHNSLHSRAPEERLSPKTLRRIEEGRRKGIATHEVTSEEQLREFSALMHRHNILKPKRYVPDNSFFRAMMASGDARLFITEYRGITVGCCACVYTGGNAYLWYSAFLRKSFIMLHPDIMTIWHAISHAYKNGYSHIFFMDVGLPFSKNPFRDFILRFGGKPVSTFRWFRISAGWLNAIMKRIYG